MRIDPAQVSHEAVKTLLGTHIARFYGIVITYCIEFGNEAYRF